MRTSALPVCLARWPVKCVHRACVLACQPSTVSAGGPVPSPCQAAAAAPQQIVAKRRRATRMICMAATRAGATAEAAPARRGQQCVAVSSASRSAARGAAARRSAVEANPCASLSVDTDTDTDTDSFIARPWALLILGGGAARCGHLGGSHAHPHAHCPAVLSDGSDLSLSLCARRFDGYLASGDRKRIASHSTTWS